MLFGEYPFKAGNNLDLIKKIKFGEINFNYNKV